MVRMTSTYRKRVKDGTCGSCGNRSTYKKYTKCKRCIDYTIGFRKKNRMKAFELIAGKDIHCNDCGCTNIDILEINHKVPIGRAWHEHYIASSGSELVSDIVKGRQKSNNFNLLCKICNIIHGLKYKNLDAYKDFKVIYNGSRRK